MRFVLRLAALSLALTSLVVCSDFKESFRSSQPLRSGGTLTIRNVNGPVEIVGWDQETVDLDAEKFADSPSLLGEIRIEVQPAGDSLSIRTVVPEHRHGSAGARLMLHVPRRVNLDEISSSNGPIRVRGITGTAKLSTSNGAIRADLSGGRFSADTSNGPIEATLRNADSREPIVLDTSNGRISLILDVAIVPEIQADTSNSPIEIHLPSETNARIEASTSNAGVFSDFEVTTRSLSKNSLEGKIGMGGPLLKLSTSNGSIHVLRN